MVKPDPDSFLWLRLPPALARDLLETIGSACLLLEAAAREKAADEG